MLTREVKDYREVMANLNAEITRQALTTSAADRPRLTDAVRRAYTSWQEEPAKLFIWFDSPLTAAAAVLLLVDVCGIRFHWRRLPRRLDLPLRSLTRPAGGPRAFTTIDLRLWMGVALADELLTREQQEAVGVSWLTTEAMRIEDAPTLKHHELVYSNLEHVAQLILDQLPESRIGKSERERLQKMFAKGAASWLSPRREVIWNLSNPLFGFRSPVTDASSVLCLKFAEKMGRIDPQPNSAIYDAFRSGGWWWPLDGICVACDNPNELHMQNRWPHHDSDAAIRFPGWSVFSINGRKVSERVVRRQYSAKDIIKEPNLEIRHIMMERFGFGRFIQETKAREIQRDRFGKLYRIHLPQEEPLWVVEVRNSTPEPDGTFKLYHLRVPPFIRTAHEAVAWSFDLAADDYDPVKET